MVPLFTLHWEEVPASYHAYELLWLVLFIFALILARARGEVRRLFGGMVYGTITEFTVYMGLEAAKFQGVGRQYDHGLHFFYNNSYLILLRYFQCYDIRNFSLVYGANSKRSEFSQIRICFGGLWLFT